MEVVKKTQCRIRIRAIMEEAGDLGVTVIVAADYGTKNLRQATHTATVELTEKESADLKRALSAVLDRKAQEIGGVAVAKAAEAEMVALHNGEAI